VPLEYSTEGLTCPIVSRLVAVMVGWPGAAQDRLPADVPGPPWCQVGPVTVSGPVPRVGQTISEMSLRGPA
jgi:hypothetical protein